MLTPMSIVDRFTVAKLLVDYWKSRGMDYNMEWAENFLEEGHAKEITSDTFFTYRDDEVKGVVSLIVYEGDVAEIRDFVVKEEYRNQGYGKKMIEELEKHSKEKSIRKLYAYVSSQEFWTKLGYEEEGVLKSHFKEGEDLVIVAKFLT